MKQIFSGLFRANVVEKANKNVLQLVLSKNPLKRKTLWFKFIFFQVMIPQQHFHSVSWYWFDKHKVALVLFTCNYTRKWTFNASTIFASHFSFVLLVLKMSCWHISASVWEKLKKKFFIFKVQQCWSIWSRTCLVIQKCQKWKYFFKTLFIYLIINPMNNYIHHCLVQWWFVPLTGYGSVRIFHLGFFC